MAIAGYHYEQRNNTHIQGAWDNSAKSSYSPTEDNRSKIVPPCDHCEGRMHTIDGREPAPVQPEVVRPAAASTSTAEEFTAKGGWGGLATRKGR